MRNWVMKIHDQMEWKKYGRPPNLARNIIHEKKKFVLSTWNRYISLSFFNVTNVCVTEGDWEPLASKFQTW